MKNVVRGFFNDARHLENMFKYLTRTSLTNVIDENFKQQIGKDISRSSEIFFISYIRRSARSLSERDVANP